MSSLTASQLAQIPEIAISFHFNTLPHQAHQERPVIDGSDDAYQVFLHCWEKESLEYEERMYIMLLNGSNQVLGVHHHATGGRMMVLADIGQMFGIVLKANATGLLIAHNHPSGRLKPSEVDKKLTKEVENVAKLLKVKLYDHLIVTPKAYFSFSDDGLL